MIDSERHALLLTHPLMTGAILIPTEPVKELCQAIYRAVIMRQLGICYTAKSGTGKTAAMMFVGEYLRSRIPGLVVFNHQFPNNPVPSIRAFFKYFLTTVGHSELKGETPDLRLRLVNRLVDDARMSGYGLVVLLLDEAQAMSVQDFNFLKDTANDLEREGVALLTVMIAQEPDFTRVIDHLTSLRRLDLISRYVLSKRPFRPYNSTNDFDNIFDAIDKMIYPEGTEKSWTEFFLPHAFAAGFRLKSESVAMFNALRRVCTASNSPLEFPARQTFFAIRAYLLDAAAFDAAELQLPSDAWDRAIREGEVQAAIQIANSSRKGVHDFTVER